MNLSNPQMRALVYYWLGRLSPSVIVILLYIYSKAIESPDGEVSESIEDIASGTGLAWGTVQIKLHELATLKAIEISSVRKERTLIRIPLRYWIPPGQTSNADEHPTTIPELVYCLCGQRVSPEMLAIMSGVADNDELRLKHCLDNFLRQRKQWETVQLLTVAVQDDLQTCGFFDDHWGG